MEINLTRLSLRRRPRVLPQSIIEAKNKIRVSEFGGHVPATGHSSYSSIDRRSRYRDVAKHITLYDNSILTHLIV